MESRGGSTFKVSDTPVPTLDLNELLLEHPAASFVFCCGGELLIVDCAGLPQEGSLVLVRTIFGFAVEPYGDQEVWGVVTYRLLHLI